MITEERIREIQRVYGTAGLVSQFQQRLERAKLIMSPYDTVPFHGMRADTVRALIEEAEAFSRELYRDK